jgi:lipopolysaccharide transport system permease protein
MEVILKSLWSYRGFILCSVRREFQMKYQNSVLGSVWTVLNPLAMITVYTVIFSQIMRARMVGSDSKFAYSIYLCSGILTWGLFAEITSLLQTIFIHNANLLKKLSFPRTCLPIITVLGALINFGIISSLFILFLIISGNFPGIVFIAVFPVLLLLLLFATGLGILLGVLNVFFRDVGHFFGIVMQFWFWLTPVIYPASILPEQMKRIMAFNPMAKLIAAFQQIFSAREWPDWNSLLPVLMLSLLLCIVSWRLFRKRSGEMMDEL